MKKLIIATVAACSVAAHAELFSGNELHRWATESDKSSLSFGMIHGYVAGIFDSGVKVTHCPPDSVTLGQAVDMVRKTLNETPSLRHISADTFVTYTLNKAWPCPKKNGGSGRGDV